MILACRDSVIKMSWDVVEISLLVCLDLPRKVISPIYNFLLFRLTIWKKGIRMRHRNALLLFVFYDCIHLFFEKQCNPIFHLHIGIFRRMFYISKYM